MKYFLGFIGIIMALWLIALFPWLLLLIGLGCILNYMNE